MSKIKLPKRLAGVKIPKDVRKGALAGFVNSPAGQSLLLEACTVAAAASEDAGDAIEDRLAGALQAALVTFREALKVDPATAPSENDSPPDPDGSPDQAAPEPD